MFQIDHPTALAEMPALTPAGTPGYFGSGNPATGEQATRVTAEWLNIVMMEFLNVLAEAGVAPDKEALNQLTGSIVILAGRAFRRASAAEVAAGLDGAKLVTPAALAGSKNLGTTGTYTHPGGFVEQWGVSDTPLTNEGNLVIPFPIPFATTCVHCEAHVINKNQVGTGGTHFQEVSLTHEGALLYLQSATTTGIQDAAGGYRWRAIGY